MTPHHHRRSFDVWSTQHAPKPSSNKEQSLPFFATKHSTSNNRTNDRQPNPNGFFLYCSIKGERRKQQNKTKNGGRKKEGNGEGWFDECCIFLLLCVFFFFFFFCDGRFFDHPFFAPSKTQTTQ